MSGSDRPVQSDALVSELGWLEDRVHALGRLLQSDYGQPVLNRRRTLGDMRRVSFEINVAKRLFRRRVLDPQERDNLACTVQEGSAAVEAIEQSVQEVLTPARCAETYRIVYAIAQRRASFSPMLQTQLSRFPKPEDNPAPGISLDMLAHLFVWQEDLPRRAMTLSLAKAPVRAEEGWARLTERQMKRYDP